MNYNRRDFIKTTSLAAGAMMIPNIIHASDIENNNPAKDILRVSQLKKPLAIAMWDYSWILRHHRYGEFENWDKVLGELADRGYNAIRIDAMPQFVAADTNNTIENSFRSEKKDWSPALWGNNYPMSFNPREALLEFLPKCSKHGIKVGLATWFMGHGTKRTEIFNEENGLLRAWDETLSFLKTNDLLDNVIYVDLLNEYPNWHGYEWLKTELSNRPNDKQSIYNNFINNLIRDLKSKYQELEFFASLDSGMHLDNIDLKNFEALDYHVWFAHTGQIPGLGEINKRDQSIDYRKVYAGLKDYWTDNKTELVNWIDGRISDISSKARENNIVCGNTEGWGPIFWFDHPDLDWRWVKESAEICVDLALKHDNYKFICSSNFTHPQFKGMWEDVKWHRKITNLIKR